MENNIVFLHKKEEINDYDTYNGNSLTVGFCLPTIVCCYCDFELPYEGPLHFTKEIFIVKNKKVELKDINYTQIKIHHVSLNKMKNMEIKYLKHKNKVLEQNLKIINEHSKIS